MPMQKPECNFTTTTTTTPPPAWADGWSYLVKSRLPKSALFGGFFIRPSSPICTNIS